jgi:hypothetical protein
MCTFHHIKEDEMGEVCSAHKKMRNAYNILVTKRGWTRPLRRTRSRWEADIKINYREIDFEYVD